MSDQNTTQAEGENSANVPNTGTQKSVLLIVASWGALQLAYLGLGLANVVAAFGQSARKSYATQVALGLVFVVFAAYIIGDTVYRRYALPATATAQEPPVVIVQVPEQPAPSVQVNVPEPLAVGPVEPRVAEGLILIQRGWFRNTPIAVQVGDDVRAIPPTHRHRFRVSAGEEIPRPAAMNRWDEIPKEATEGLVPTKIFLVG